MTADGKRQVSVGQTAKHHGADVEITTVAPDGDNVKVSYPYAHKSPTWVKVEDLDFPDSLFNSPGDTGPDNELYPVGTVLSNGAGETVKVVDRFKGDVKLQLGKVDGALTTDFQPSDDEPFTMSEADLTEWLSKTLPSTALDTTPMTLPLHTWGVGERARLLCDMPHDLFPLYEGDEGAVVQSGDHLGFQADRYRKSPTNGGGATFYRTLNGKQVHILDQCETVTVDDFTPEADETPDAVTTDIEILLERNAFLEKEREALLFNNNLLNKEHDKYMEAAEDAGKLAAALADAQKRIERLEAEKAQLEKKNEQQSDMLRERVITPIEHPQQRIKTLMTTGGSNGFAEVCIPHGWEIAAITTEFYAPNGTPQLVRMVHLIGCDSPAPVTDEVHEKVTVEFVQAANSFEDLLRGETLMVEAHDSELQPSLLEKLKADKPIFTAITEYGLEAVKESLDDKVLNAARTAYENALAGTDWQPKRFERLLRTGNVNSDEVTQKNDVLLEVFS